MKITFISFLFLLVNPVIAVLESPAIEVVSFDVEQTAFSYYLMEYSYWYSITNNHTLTSKVLDLPPHLRPYIVALVFHESGFNPQAVGRNADSSDYGLFQLNSNVYISFSESELLNEKLNINLGVAHFLIEYSRFDGNIERTLQAYNAGPGRVMRNEVPDSTLKHAKNIMNTAIDYSLGLSETFSYHSW